LGTHPEESLIFRKFLNIETMVNIMKSREDDGFPMNETDFDVLFDTYLKPLRSRNARRIFKVLFEERKFESLTTLDIQTKLGVLGIRLSKKEINGWLRSLLDAGLVLKDAERGKPTTLEYDGKYTFDMWRITEIGVKIAKNLPNIIEEPSRFEDELTFDRDKPPGLRTLGCSEEEFLFARMLRELFEAGGEMNRKELRRRLEPTDDDLNRVLSSRLNQLRGSTLIVQERRSLNLKSRLLSLLGLTSGDEVVYVLTEEGRQLARVLRCGEDVGHGSRL